MSKSQLKKSDNGFRAEGASPNDPIIHQFNHAQYWGYGLIIFIYTVAEYSQEWESLKYFFHPSLEPNKILFIFRVILFVELVILSSRWLIATINELDMWSNAGLDWSHWTNSPFSRQNAYTALLGLGVLLGLLLASINNILILSSILSCYFLFNYWTQWLCSNHFGRALNDTKISKPLQKKDWQL